MLSQITWITLWGLSLLFVGGFVLWIYGARKTTSANHPHAAFAHWFLLYGATACFGGVGCLLTAALMLL